MVVVQDPAPETDTVAGVEGVPRRVARTALHAWCARRWLDRASWLALAAGLNVILVYFALPAGGTAQAAIQVGLCAASAAATGVAAARTRGLTRMVWAWHAAALTFLTMGTGYLYVYPLVTGHPLVFPSPADALVLVMYPCIGVALWALAKLSRGEDHRGDLLDVLIMVAGIGALMWVSVLGPAVHARDLPLLAHVVSVSYPVADLMLLAMLARLLIGSRRSGAMRLLAAASGLMAVADTLLAFQLASDTSKLGILLDCLYLLNCAFMVAAAFHPSARTFAPSAATATHRLTMPRLVFLGAALMAFPILLATGPDDVVLIAALAVSTFVAVLARMSRLNRRLDGARRSIEDKSAQLRHQAFHDGLTGLPNRALIMDRLEHLLAGSGRPGSAGVAAMFIDLDGFKDVNDTLGHEVGDKLLQSVAGRLRGSLRDGETIGRLGGDEFVVLLDGVTDPYALESIAERIVDVIGQPFEIQGWTSPIRVTTSIGIAAGPAATSHELLRDADMALYDAKAAGKNCYIVFQPETRTAVQRRHLLEQDLRSALQAEQFQLVYQPIYRLKELDIAGFEALLRWEHPSLGLIEPAEMIPLLESTGKIADVGRWVLREACDQMAIWRGINRDLIVSVTISHRQFGRDAIVEHVHEALTASGLAPSALTLDISETSLMCDIEASIRRLHQLKALGVQIAIDDFGVGHSSLAHLQRLPVDRLKIGRAFTAAVTLLPESAALLHMLIQLGRQLGLKTLAKGVETATQIDRLRAGNVDEIQGFLLTPPLDPDDIEALLLDHDPQTLVP